MDIGSTVSFPEWDDTTGDPITLTGTVEAEFTDPEERHARPSLRVRTAAGCFTPYRDECRPAVAAESPKLNLYYANEAGKGMTAILGLAGKEADTVESNAYRATEAELSALVDEIKAEFAPREIVRFDTIAALEAAYNGGVA